jgi:hypothetical protein
MARTFQLANNIKNRVLLKENSVYIFDLFIPFSSKKHSKSGTENGHG